MGLYIKSVITSERFGWIVRLIQYAFTIINLGLGAYNIKIYSSEIYHHGSIGYFLAVSIITTTYLSILANLSSFSPQSIIPGAVIIVESIIEAFWFSSFIAVAVDYGKLDCYYYSSMSYFSKSHCGAIKATIAFGLFDFLMFALTTVIFSSNVIKPLTIAKVNIWGPIKDTNYHLNGPIMSLNDVDSYNINKGNDVEAGTTTNE